MSEKSAPVAKGRGERTADAIEKAALELVLEHGYADVTVAMISEAAGISQRTFFNHYPTKEDALLGRHMPRIDQSAARRFIVGTGPVLLDAIGIVTPPPMDLPFSLEERMRVVTSHPDLLAAQMRRVFALEEELGEIIQLRVRTEHPDLPEEEVEPTAEMITSLIGGMIRSLGHLSHQGFEARAEGAERSYDDVLERARELLATILHVGPA